VPGKENIYNALGAISVSQILKISLNRTLHYLKPLLVLKKVFHSFTIKRLAIIDDYAHHPEEILATLRGTREFYPKKIFG